MDERERAILALFEEVLGEYHRAEGTVIDERGSDIRSERRALAGEIERYRERFLALLRGERAT